MTKATQKAAAKKVAPAKKTKTAPSGAASLDGQPQAETTSVATSSSGGVDVSVELDEISLLKKENAGLRREVADLRKERPIAMTLQETDGPVAEGVQIDGQGAGLARSVIPSDVPPGIDPADVKRREGAGLRRDQAIEAAVRQKRHNDQIKLAVESQP